MQKQFVSYLLVERDYSGKKAKQVGEVYIIYISISLICPHLFKWYKNIKTQDRSIHIK